MRVPARAAELNVVPVLGILVVACLFVLAGGFVGSDRLSSGVLLSTFLAVDVTLLLSPQLTRQTQLVVVYVIGVLLTAYPVARVVVGPDRMPIYFLDLAVGLLLSSLLLQREWRRYIAFPAHALPALVIVFWLPLSVQSFLHEVLLTGVWVETTYVLVRNLLSISLFFVLIAVVHTFRELRTLLWCMVVGVLVTALLSTIQTFLPPDSIFLKVQDFFSPADLMQKQERYYELNLPVRSRALIGSPNAAGMIMVSILPIIFGLHRSSRSVVPRLLCKSIFVLAIVGIVATYSRSAYLGLGIVFGMFILRLRHRRWALRVALVIGLLLAVIATASGLVALDYITDKFVTSLTDPSSSPIDRPRLETYQNVPAFLQTHPGWLVVGRGFATYDLNDRGFIEAFDTSEIFHTQNHSVFVMVFYQRGLIAAFVIGLIWLAAFSLLATGRRDGLTAYAGDSWLRFSLQVGLLSMLPAWLFNHYFASVVHMQAYLFLYLALCVLAVKTDAPHQAAARNKRPSATASTHPRVAIIQNQFGLSGRTRVVCEVIDMLNAHDIVPDVLTLTSKTASKSVGQYFGLGQVRFNHRRIAPVPFVRGGLWQILLANWLTRARHSDYDLVFNSNNLLEGLNPAAYYIHYVYYPLPTYSRELADSRRPVWLQVYARLFDWLLRRGDTASADDPVLVISQFTRDALVDVYPAFEGRVQVIYPPAFDGFMNDNPVRERRCISVGSFAPVKRQLEQLEIARRLPDIEFWLVGNIKSARYYRACQQYAARHRLTNVQFKPDLPGDALQEALEHALFFLHTMQNEHFGICVVEAIAAGCMPVVHRSGGPREIVSNDAFCFDNTDQAVQIFERLQNTAPESLVSMRRELQQRIQPYSRRAFREALGRVLWSRLGFDCKGSIGGPDDD